MSRAKYITGEVKCDGGLGSVATALCFGEILGHSDLIGRFSEIWGAGFFFIGEDGKVTAYGKSVSLGVDSREEKDAQMIEKALGLKEEY
jgi:hypothetical protein